MGTGADQAKPGGVQLGTVTWSNTAMHKSALLCAVTASPTYAVPAIANVAVPCCVQLVPSAER